MAAGGSDVVIVTRTGLHEALARGRGLVGTFCIVPSTDVVELIALAGFDFVVLDMEHGPFTIETVKHCLLAAHARALPVVVRVRASEPALIGAALDIGADGVLVPQVSSAAMARQVVAAARFAPRGSRGANPWVRAAAYAGEPGWFAEANRTVVVMVMVEGREGLAAAGEIVGVPGLDAVFLGPVDMSHSLGVPGEVDHPLVVDALEEIARTAAGQGVATAVFAADPRRAHEWRLRGVQLIACGVDSDIIGRALARTAAAAREGDGAGTARTPGDFQSTYSTAKKGE